MAKKNFVITNNMHSLLKQVHLGGIINECVVNVKKGKATIEAIDITNSIVFVSTLLIGSKKLSTQLGLGNVEMIIKFLSTMTDKKLNIDLTENRMMISRKDKRRRLEYLLSQPALIATRLKLDDEDTEDPKEKFLNMVEVRSELTESFIKDFNSYIATLKTKIVTIEVDENDSVFTLGPKTEHQFKLSLPLADESDDKFTLKVNGEYLSKILSAVEIGGEESDPVTIGFGDEAPIIIESETAMWAISPSEEIEDE